MRISVFSWKAADPWFKAWAGLTPSAHPVAFHQKWVPDLPGK